ncbi:MAG: ABC transporter permease [Acidimicrobiales bacterium]
MSDRPTTEPVVSSEYSDTEYSFGPHSATPPDVREYLHALWQRRAFMDWLARTELRSRRTSTSLGNIWAVLDPLFQAGIYFFLYMVLRGGARADFLPVLIAVIFLFRLTLDAMGDGGNSIKKGKGLLLNSTFPRALLPITSVYTSLLGYVPSVCVVLVIFPLVGGRVGVGVFMLPLLFVIQAVMNVGIALLVSTVVVLVKDASNAMQYVTRILFFTTPVIYPASMLPDNLKVFVAVQPLFSLFASYQRIFMGGMPSAGMVLLAATWAVALVIGGSRLFLRHEREFALHL